MMLSPKHSDHGVGRRGKQGTNPKMANVESKQGSTRGACSIPIQKLFSNRIMAKLKRFSHTELQNFTNGFSVKLSSNVFGVVFRGVFPNLVKVAVKVLAETDIAEEIFMAEVGAMALTDHPNILKLYGFCFDLNTKGLVYEYVETGSLDKYLYKNHCPSIEWEKLYNIAVDTAKALSYLHDGCCKQIIHQDVKASNILLDLTLSPKIAGFGLATLMNRDVGHFTLTQTRGSPTYAAPEMWMATSQVTYKCDVYSFGMLLFEILGRRNNIRDEEWFPKQVWESFETAQLDEMLEECAMEKKNRKKAEILTKVALWCIQFMPQSRPTMSTVVEVLQNEIQVSIPPDPFLVSSATMKKVFY